ncbi:ral guanine nucleotide dissociation stimulator-like isoform X1 [Dipodomys merriami]|uniref:ral guanine nucleotide dissociation stimulator-like isoform X1 n=1 Tax=Dipodomys merriami TaxID=94247 RepID=UPI0038557B95
MFSCCIRRSRDSGLRQESYRRWISAKPRIQHLRQFFKKPREIQGNSGQGGNYSALTLNVPNKVWSPEAGLLEKLVMNLVPAHQKGDLFFIQSFLHSYRQCGTMDQVLAILFKKYRSLRPRCEEDEQVKNALCSFFTMWMDCYPDDFRECKNRDSLNDLMYYIMLNMPSSDLLLRLQVLLDQLEEPVTNKTKKKRKKATCRCLTACFGRRRAASPERELQNQPVMSAMMTDGVLEPSPDCSNRVNIQRFVPFAVRPKEILNPVDTPLVVNPTCDTGEPAGIPEEDEDPEFLPLTFTVRLDRLQTSQTDTPLIVQDQLTCVPNLSSGEPLNEVQNLDSVKESEFVLTEYADKSFLLKKNQSPIEKLESALPSTQKENPAFLEVDPFEDSDLEFLPEVNLETYQDLEFPSPIPGKISILLFVMTAVIYSFYLFL